MGTTTISHATLGTVKLGRRRPVSIQNVGRFKVVTLDSGKQVKLARLSMNYDRTKDASPPPASVDYSPKALANLAQMDGNDRLGDCVIAGKCHLWGVWTGNASGTPVLAVESEVENNYRSICGPGDNGCNITDVLDAMKAGEFIMAGTPAKIDDYVAVAASKNLIMVAIDLFGGITLGVNLTDDCTDSGPGVVWNFRGRIVGGHDITGYAYDDKGVYIATWATIGTLIPWSVMGQDAGNNPGVEERYVALSSAWLDASQLAPNGINVDTLKADLEAIASGNVPDVPPPAPPTPPVPPTPPTPPVPPLTWWQRIIAWLESLIASHHAATGSPKKGADFGTGAEFGLTKDATLDTVNWQALIAWIKAELALYGPAIVPVIQAWINMLPVPIIVKTVLSFLLTLLANQLPPAPPPVVPPPIVPPVTK